MSDWADERAVSLCRLCDANGMRHDLPCFDAFDSPHGRCGDHHAIATALRAARAEALEEGARVCEAEAAAITARLPSPPDDSRETAREIEAAAEATSLAETIRALITEGEASGDG